MERRKYKEALGRYQEGLAKIPDSPGLVFNGGLAAYMRNDFATEERLWKSLTELDPIGILEEKTQPQSQSGTNPPNKKPDQEKKP